MLIVMLWLGTLLLLEPDLGAFVVIIGHHAMAYSVFGGDKTASVWLALAGFGVHLPVNADLGCALSTCSVFLAYMDPWDEPYAQGKAYQLCHALIAFGRGECFGVGLGGSVEKLFYLPEAHTDFCWR